jgi:plasmid stabilization system protein ParE
VSYKLTRKAAADLAALVDFSLERFGGDAAIRYIDRLERSLEALDRSELEGPELVITSRARSFGGGPYHRTGSTTTGRATFFVSFGFITERANRSERTGR